MLLPADNAARPWILLVLIVLLCGRDADLPERVDVGDYE